ncbi:hypothetical protein NQT62_10885 [Limnobacter humi]|uniref:GP-PDE domain-containing protein n=1 Tax=Limnobacter humi TaxID=1778671 RepID=A0ABT1WHF3_9BURK|nr:glycerophosphodiester phosphodiesterase family protein [Limnobacter humi]MCQ8896936.1 hypothetical protein [Limnobacter humi]
MKLWAHRGSGKGALENTLKGFQTALDNGFDAVEFDVMLTADGHAFVHHDWVMGRCAQSVDPALAGTDSVTRFDSLRASDLRHYSVAGEPVPRLVEVLDWCLQHNISANVELKATDPANARQLGQVVRQQVEACTLEQQAHIRQHWLFSSFYHASLLPLQGLTLAVLYEAFPDDWVLHADALGAQAVHLHWSAVDATVVRRIHTSGRQVRVYTVNDEDTLRTLAALGVDGAFTDRMAFGRHSF